MAQSKKPVSSKLGQRTPTKHGKATHSQRTPMKSGKSTHSQKKTSGPPPVQQRTKSFKSQDKKTKKRRVYSEKELNLAKLNMITPAGVQKPRGKKKGKVFVDDPLTMHTILAMVNAETEGKIESKMLKARQMEELREARQREIQAKEEQRKVVLESKKTELRAHRKKPKAVARAQNEAVEEDKPVKRIKKKVSFG